MPRERGCKNEYSRAGRIKGDGFIEHIFSSTLASIAQHADRAPDDNYTQFKDQLIIALAWVLAKGVRARDPPAFVFCLPYRAAAGTPPGAYTTDSIHDLVARAARHCLHSGPVPRELVRVEITPREFRFFVAEFK